MIKLIINEQSFFVSSINIKRNNNLIYITLVGLEGNLNEDNYINKEIKFSINNYKSNFILRKITLDKTTKNYIIIGEEY